MAVTRGRGVPRSVGLSAAAAAVMLTCLVLLSPLARTSFGLYYDDVGLAVAAAAASGAAVWRARGVSGRDSAAWWAMAAGSAGYAAGEAWWCCLQLGSHVDPFPSPADVGYLSLPVAACAALLVHPASIARGRSFRRLIDAVMVTTSVAIVSWDVVLSPVLHSRSETHFALLLSLAYPASDIAVLTLAVLTVAGLEAGALPWTLVAGGLMLLSVADSGFAYLSAVSTYSGGLVDVAYIAAFVVLALAACTQQGLEVDAAITSKVPGRARLLPYIPALVALLVTLARTTDGLLPDATELYLLALVVLAVLIRQYLSLREITELTRALAAGEARLRHQAFHDGLTGLVNRSLFHDRLHHALSLHARDLRPVSVLFLDLDDFKLVNDVRGHHIGDGLLVAVAQRLLDHTREGDTVARLGGDEFAILVEQSDDPDAVAIHVEDALRPSFALDGLDLTVTASIGIVAVDASTAAMTADQLMAAADTAMYAAKRGGKGRIERFSVGMSLAEVVEQELVRDLLAGLTDGSVHVAYQPVVDISNGTVHGVEALARWTHHGQEISPATFIPLAERNAAMRPLTDFMLDQACSRIAEWSVALGHRRLMVGINVPPVQLASPDFAARLAAAITRHNVGPRQLVVEITETSLIADTEQARDVIAELHRLGVRVSLDDFGVGYSSLARLHALRIDSVKIDKSFLDSIDSDSEQASFVGAILNLGRSLDLPVIAEGIERSTQVQELRRLGGVLVQGWYFAKALSPTEALEYIRGDRAQDILRGVSETPVLRQ